MPELCSLCRSEVYEENGVKVGGVVVFDLSLQPEHHEHRELRLCVSCAMKLFQQLSYLKQKR